MRQPQMVLMVRMNRSLSGGIIDQHLGDDDRRNVGVETNRVGMKSNHSLHMAEDKCPIRSAEGRATIELGGCRSRASVERMEPSRARVEAYQSPARPEPEMRGVGENAVHVSARKLRRIVEGGERFCAWIEAGEAEVGAEPEGPIGIVVNGPHRRPEQSAVVLHAGRILHKSVTVGHVA